jgi:hypothetical protein
MICPTRKLSAIILFCFFLNFSFAQDPGPGPKDKLSSIEKKENKPFRVQTSGRKVTVKSNKNIDYIIAWTTNGHRFVEQARVGSSSFNFTAPVNEKVIFLMLELNGRRYTEKIGVQ